MYKLGHSNYINDIIFSENFLKSFNRFYLLKRIPKCQANIEVFHKEFDMRIKNYFGNFYRTFHILKITSNNKDFLKYPKD
jgi:hypothetical protein